MWVSIGCIGMIDLILVILILAVAAVAFNLEARRKVLRRRQVERLERLQKLREETGDAGTIDLIGEQAYRDMTARIDGILERHGHQPCLTLNLSCGPDTDKGSDELHTLLPGEPVEIVPCGEGGVEWYDVYFNGARVGRFVLAEASLPATPARCGGRAARHVARRATPPPSTYARIDRIGQLHESPAQNC